MFIKALKGTFIKKVITLFVVFTFIWGDSSWAFSLMPVNFSSAPQSSSELLLDKLSSLEQAKIEEVRYYKNQDSPFVIHIQDAHANSNAQKNIEAILEKITKFSKDNESSIWIALEGAKGLIHPEYFDFFKNDVKANDLIISDLLEKGELTGAELFAWEQYKLNQKENSNIHFVGVEDSDVYLKNFQAYKKMMEVKPNADNLVRKLYLQISSKTSNEFNSDLLDFVKTRQKYKLGKHDVTSAQKGDGELSVYLEHLFSRLSNDLQIDLDSSFEQLRFPQLVRFSKMQKALHNLKEIELKQSLEELSAKISAVKKTKEENEWFVAWRDAFAGHAWLDHENSSEIKKTKFSPRHLFESMIRFMNENKIEVELSDQIKNAMKIIVFEYEMDAALLFDEIQQVEDALFEKLIKNDAEKEYVQLFKQLELHEKLFSLELTKSDFKKYQSNQTSNLFDLYLDDQEKINLEGFKSIAEDFYQFADERDQSLFRNTMNTYREYLSPTNEVIKNPKNTVLVLVSGGFHTEGLTELFDEQKISHAVIRPQIYSMDSEDKYHDVMSHKNADLSYYFGVQNPFETHQQALFYRSIIEKVMPYFMEEKKLSYDEMYQVLEESFQGHPLFKAKVKLQQTVIDQKPAFQFRVMNEKNKDAQALVKMLVSADASLHLRLKEVMVRRGTLRSFDYAFSGKKRETVVAQSMSRAELRQTDAKSVDSLGTDLYQIFIQGHEANWLLLAGTIAVAAAVLFGPKLIANSRWYAKQKLQGIENYYQDQPSRLSALFFGVSAERFENDIRYIQNISKKYEAARLNILKLKRQGKRVSEDLEQDAALNKKAKDTLSTILRLMSELLENDPQNKRLAREYHILLDVLENDFLIQAIQSELDSSYRAVTRTKSGVKSELAIIIAKLQRSELRVAEESLALDYEQYRSWPLADLMHSLNNKIGIIMMILEIVSEPDYLKDFEESYFYREVGKSIEDLKSRRMRMPELNRDEALRETVDYFQSVYQVFAEPQLEKEILSFESHERIGDYHQMLLKARQQVIDFTGTWLGLIPAIPMEVSLRSFLEEVTRTVLDHRGDGIKINFNIPDEANRKIFTYPIDLQDVLENLLVNAFHATDPAKTGRQREITISAKYIAVSDTHPEAIEISIQDNGTGMSQDVAGRIFEEGFTTKAQLGSQTQKPSLKIFRGDEESDTAEVEGTGIGMPSVKNKLETRLDGSIRFETEENVGTIFTLTLPMRVSDKAIQPNIKQRAELRVKAEDLTRGTVISNQSTGVRRIVLFNSADAFKNFGRSANLPEHALITLILVEGRSPRINLIDQREALERLNQENSTTLLRQFRDYPEDTRRRFFGMMDSATQALKQIYEAGEPLFIADETGTIKVERLSELEKRVEKIDNDKSPVLRTVLPQPRVQIESPTVDVAEGQLEKYADAIEGLAEHLLASAYTLDNLKVMFPLYMELHDGMDDARDTMGELYKKLDSATEAFLLSRQIDEPWGSSGRKLILKLTNEMLQSRSELRSDEGAESILGALNDSQREALQRYFDDREAHRELVKFLRFDQSTPVVRGNKSIHAEFLLFPEIFDKTDFYVHYGKIGEAWQSVKLEPKKLRWTEYENRTRYLLDFEMPFTEAGEYGVTFFAEPKGAVNQNLTVWQSSNPDDAARIIIDDETSVRSLRWISAFSGESFASSGEAKISFDIDPKSLDRVEFFGRVQKHDAPGFSYEVPLSKKELRPIKGGGYILTIPVDPRENGDYRVDLFARSKDGKDILTSDLKRPALLKIYRSIDEIQSLKSALSSYQAFIDYVNLQMSSASIQDINQFLFDATKNDESLRILVSKYFGILDGIMKREGIESLHNQGLLPIYQILNTLGIGKDITFVTPEGAQAIGGGIGSVIRGLPDSLAEAGVPITIITNLYEENLKNKHRSAEEVLADGFEIHGKVVKPVEIGTVDIPYGPIYFSGTKNIQTPSYTITAKVYLAENNGVRYLLLRHPEMANRLYPDMSSSETLKRAIFLSRGALEIAKKKFEYGDGQVLNLQPSTMFSHDWVAGLISYLNTVDDTYLADFKLQNMKVGHFIHNFSYQGRIFVNEDGYRDIWGLLNVGDQHFFGLADPNDLNFLNPTAASVTYSTAGLWAPSAPYAREIVTADGGQGLHYLLRRRIDDLSGISNGIELQSARKTFWKTGIVAEQLTQYDRAENLSSLSASKRVERLKKYRAEILSGASGKLNDELSKFDELDEDAFVDAIPHLKKLALKAAQVEYGLKEDDDAILFSFVGRVAEQKGLQLLAEKGASGKSILEEILDKYPKAQFIFGGPPAPGDAEMQDFLKLVNELAQRYPDRLHARLEMVPPSEALAIMFASHYFLMPSKYEPGGITQLEAMAGGTVVIGRKTGGIAATIFDYDLDQERGNGFLFQDFSGVAFQKAIENAVEAFIAEPALKETLLLRTLRQKTDWFFRVVPSYLAFLQSSAGALKHNYPHFRSVVRALSQTKVVRSELRTEEVELKDPPYGGFAINLYRGDPDKVAPEPLNTLERKINLRSGENVSFFFNVNTQSAISNVEDLILARAYVRKGEDEEFEEGDVLELLEDFENGDYRFGYELPTDFSGELTFQYSVDGGETWQWANQGREENYVISRINTKDIFESTERKLERVKSVLWTKSRIARLESGSVDLIFNIIKRSFPPEHILAESVSVERLALEFEHAFYNYLDFTRDSHASSVMTAFNPEKVQLSELIVATQSRIGVTDLIRSVIEKKGYTVAYDEKAARFNDVATGKKITVYFYEIHDAKNRALDKSEVSELITDIKSALAEHDRKFEQELHVKVSAKTGDMILQGKVGIVRHLPGNLESVASDIFATDDGEPMSEEEMAKAVDEDLKRLENAVEVLEQSMRLGPTLMPKNGIQVTDGLLSKMMTYIQSLKDEAYSIAMRAVTPVERADGKRFRISQGIHRQSALNIFLNLAEEHTRLVREDRLLPLGAERMTAEEMEYTQEFVVHTLRQNFALVGEDDKRDEKDQKIKDEVERFRNAVKKAQGNIQVNDDLAQRLSGIQNFVNTYIQQVEQNIVGDIDYSLDPLYGEIKQMPIIALRAIETVVIPQINQLKNVGGSINLGIATDAESFFKQVIAAMRGQENSDLIGTTSIESQDKEEVVIFAKELNPWKMMQLMHDYKIKAVVTTGASIATHWVLVAENSKIPVLTVDEANPLFDISDPTWAQQEVIIDGVKKVMILNANPQTYDQYVPKLREHETLRRLAQKVDPSTLPIKLAANADTLPEVQNAMDDGVDDVGLVRTEYQFGAENQKLRKYLERYREMESEAGISENASPVQRMRFARALGSDEVLNQARLDLISFLRTIFIRAWRLPSVWVRLPSVLLICNEIKKKVIALLKNCSMLSKNMVPIFIKHR
jgi:glycogen synthase/signal transduction histidine kinase